MALAMCEEGMVGKYSWLEELKHAILNCYIFLLGFILHVESWILFLTITCTRQAMETKSLSYLSTLVPIQDPRDLSTFLV